MFKIINIFILKSHIETKEDLIDSKINFQSTPLENKEKKNIFQVIFSLDGNFPVNEKNGYHIEYKLVAIFELDNEIDEEKKNFIMKKNIPSILYGYLRAELASRTAVFPLGKVLLPPVYFKSDKNDTDKKTKKFSEKPEKYNNEN